MQLLPNGKAFMGWADLNAISEHAPDGKVLDYHTVQQYTSLSVLREVDSR